MSRGYHLLLPHTITELPEGAIQGVKMKSSVACSTEQLAGLNERIRESLLCIYMLSNSIMLVRVPNMCTCKRYMFFFVII